MDIVVVKRDERYFSEIMPVIGNHITGGWINKHFIVCQQIKCLACSSPECLTLCICPVFIYRIIIPSCIVDVRIHSHGSDQPAFKATVKHRDDLLRRNNCPFKTIIALPVMHPADRSIGSIHTQFHAVLCILITQGFRDTLIARRTAYIEQRRCGKRIGRFLVHDQTMKVPGNPVVCVAQRIVGFLFFLIFLLITKQYVRLIAVITFCYIRTCHKCRMTGLIFFYQLFHCINIHCYLTSKYRCFPACE